MASSGLQRILDGCGRLSAAADVAAWSAAAPACHTSCRPVLNKTLPPAAVSWLQQHGFYGALTSALAAGLRILQQQLSDTAVAANDQTLQLAQDIVLLLDNTSSWDEATGQGLGETVAGAGPPPEALSADFAPAAAAVCGTLAQLLPELTQQELAAQQRFEQQAGRAARRHVRAAEHFPPSPRLLVSVRLSWKLLQLWATHRPDPLAVEGLKHPEGCFEQHQPQATACAATAGEQQPGSASAAAALGAGDSAAQSATSSGSHSAMTGRSGSSSINSISSDAGSSGGSGSADSGGSGSAGSGGSGSGGSAGDQNTAAVFPEFVVHGVPLAAAVVHCWQQLQHSAADNAAWVGSQQMRQLNTAALGTMLIAALRIARDIHQVCTAASTNNTAAQTGICQLPPQLPWLLMHCVAAFTAAMHEASKGTSPINLSSPSAAASASNSSRRLAASSRRSGLQVPPHHTLLLDALWAPGPHPPDLRYSRLSNVSGNGMPPDRLMHTVFVLTMYLTGSASSSYSSNSTADGSQLSSAGPVSTPGAAAADASPTAAPGKVHSWWGLSLQALQLLPPVVAECMALAATPLMVSIGVHCLKSLIYRLHDPQQQPQQQGHSGPGTGSAGRPGSAATALSSSDLAAGPGGTASEGPSMLEVAAQLVVPAAQHVMVQCAAAGGLQHDAAATALQTAYRLVAANAGPGMFFTQGAWQVPGLAVLTGVEAAVRAQPSWGDPSSATNYSIGQALLDIALTDIAAAANAAALKVTGPNQGPAPVPGLPAGLSSPEGLLQQQHSSSRIGGSGGTAADPGADPSSISSLQPQACLHKVSILIQANSRVSAAWAGLLASCLKATAASRSISSQQTVSDSAAGCVAQPSSTSTAVVQPAAEVSSPAAAQPACAASANIAAAPNHNAVCDLLGVASLACMWSEADADTTAAAGATGSRSSAALADARQESVSSSPGPASTRRQRPSPSQQKAASGQQSLFNDWQLQLPPSWGFVVGKALYHAGSLLAAPGQAAALPAPAPAGASAVGGVLAVGVPAAVVYEVVGPIVSVCEGVRSMVQHLAPADVLGWEQAQLLGLVATLSDAVTQAEALLQGMGGAVGQGSCDQAAAAAPGSQAGDDAGQPVLDHKAAWALLLGTPAAQQLSQALLDLGAALCACLPSKTACNHPACTVLDRVSEAQLVSGRGKTCSGCMLARYCCAEHQQLHWKAHKAACRALAEGARQAAGGSSSHSGGSSSTGQKKKMKSTTQGN